MTSRIAGTGLEWTRPPIACVASCGDPSAQGTNLPHSTFPALGANRPQIGNRTKAQGRGKRRERFVATVDQALHANAKS